MTGTEVMPVRESAECLKLKARAMYCLVPGGGTSAIKAGRH